MAEPSTYRAIADGLRKRIDSGELGAGSMVPSEASLMAQYGVARGTVRAALSLLDEVGLIEVIRGQGRRVTGEAPADRPPMTAYEKIAVDLRRRIDAGEFGIADPLPSETALIERYEVSRNTVRRAYRHLSEQGVVVIRHGSGAYLAPR